MKISLTAGQLPVDYGYGTQSTNKILGRTSASDRED
jgi:hypothetical protein